MRKRTSVVALGLGLLMAVAFGLRAADDPPKTAAATVNQFFALLKAGNFNEAARYFAPVPPPGVDAAEILKKIADDLKSGQKTVTLIDSQEEGDLAVVILKILDKDNSFDHMPSAMLRKDGLWRIYPSSGPKKKKDEKKEVRPDDDNYGQPDIELEGAARKKMNWLWSWAMERCEELNMASKQKVKPSIPGKKPDKVKPGSPASETVAPIDTIRRWAKAFTSREPAEILRFYAPSDDLVVILSSGHQFKGYAQVKDLYEKSPQGFHFFESEVSELTGGRSQDVAWVTCRHRARYRVPTDDRQWQLEVRTTFVLKRDKGDWRIFLEHSSPIADVPRMKPLASSQGAAVNPPKSAVNTFNRILALLKAGDIDAAAKYFNAPDPEMAEGLKRAANRLQSGQLTVTLVDSKEEGDLAVVIVKAVDVDQGEEAGALYEANAMRRTDGTWRVYGTKIRAPGTKAASEADAKGKIEKPPKAKKEVPPSTWEPDINLEGTDKEKMAVLWKWAQARCAELRKDSKKPARPNIPPDGPNIPPTGDFKQTKEWQALNRLVGSWDYLVTSSDPKTNQGRISSTAAWTLGDRFLQFRSRRGNNTESMSLLTYDPNRGVIRWWYFSSLGQTTVFSGSWDETTNTFTFKEQDTGPMTSISTDHFIDDDHRELKDIIKGPDGKVVLEMSYKGTRQKRTSQAPGKAQGAVKPPSAGAAGG